MPIFYFKGIIRLSKTLHYQFQMATYSCVIDQNLLLKKQVIIKTWAKLTKKRLETFIYMHQSLKNSFQSQKVNQSA